MKGEGCREAFDRAIGFYRKLKRKRGAGLFSGKNLLDVDEVARVLFSDFAMIYIERVSVPGKRSYLTDISLLKNLIVYFGDLYLHEICDYHEGVRS